MNKLAPRLIWLTIEIILCFDETVKAYLPESTRGRAEKNKPAMHPLRMGRNATGRNYSIYRGKALPHETKQLDQPFTTVGGFES